MKKITTVLGDILPENLGLTTIHEHPFMRADSDGVLPLPDDATPEKTKYSIENLTYLKTTSCSWTMKEYLGNDSLDYSTRELLEFKKFGGNGVLDATYIGARIDNYTEKIKALSKATGINIICGTGYYGDYMYPVGFDYEDKQQIKKT